MGIWPLKTPVTAMPKNLLILLLLAFPPLLAAQATGPSPAPAASIAQTTTSLPEVVLHTSQGDITIELYPDRSPKSVANFLDYARSDFYAGTVFHRAIKGYLVQGGIYTRQLTEKRTHDPVPAEADNGLSNLRGTVAVARGGDPDSGTSQFFINLVDNRRLDYVSKQSGLTWGYTVFGKVIKGMDVVDKIGDLPTHAQGPFAGDVPKPLVVIEGVDVTGGSEPASATSAPANASTTAGNQPKPATKH